MYGWLGERNDICGNVAGVTFDATLPTRNEEYALLHDTLKTVKPGLAYDAGTGSIPQWHVAPYILSALGWCVHALDCDPNHLKMPKAPNVRRYMGYISHSYLPPKEYDLVICISVLEHCDVGTQNGFAADALRLLRRKGMLIVTADRIKPERLVGLFDGFDFGERSPDPKQQLSPRVSYAVGRKLR